MDGSLLHLAILLNEIETIAIHMPVALPALRQARRYLLSFTSLLYVKRDTKKSFQIALTQKFVVRSSANCLLLLRSRSRQLHKNDRTLSSVGIPLFHATMTTKERWASEPSLAGSEPDIQETSDTFDALAVLWR